MPADFMTAAGPLYHWPAGRTRTPDGPVPAADLRCVRGAGPELDYSRYQDLWFYLATRDPRITRAWTGNSNFSPVLGQCCLHEPGTGTAWIHMDGTASLAGPPHLLNQLTEMIDNRDNLRRPALIEWYCDLFLTGPKDAALYVPNHWKT